MHHFDHIKIDYQVIEVDYFFLVIMHFFTNFFCNNYVSNQTVYLIKYVVFKDVVKLRNYFYFFYFYKINNFVRFTRSIFDFLMQKIDFYCKVFNSYKYYLYLFHFYNYNILNDFEHVNYFNNFY